jgi:hypothetical protein
MKILIITLFLAGCISQEERSTVSVTQIDICSYRFYVDHKHNICFADSRENKYLHTMIDCSVVDRCVELAK